MHQSGTFTHQNRKLILHLFQIHRFIILGSDTELKKFDHAIQLRGQIKYLNQTILGKLYSLGLPFSTYMHHM